MIVDLVMVNAVFFLLYQISLQLEGFRFGPVTALLYGVLIDIFIVLGMFTLFSLLQPLLLVSRVDLKRLRTAFNVLTAAACLVEAALALVVVYASHVRNNALHNDALQASALFLCLFGIFVLAQFVLKSKRMMEEIDKLKGQAKRGGDTSGAAPDGIDSYVEKLKRLRCGIVVLGPAVRCWRP